MVSRDLSEYPLILVSDMPAIERNVKEMLLDYAKKGGALVVCGAATAGLFTEALGIEVLKTVTDEPILYLSKGADWIEVRQAYSVLRPLKGTVVTDTMEKREKGQVGGNVRIPAVVRRRIGRGTITGIALDLGFAYQDERKEQLRGFFSRACQAAKMRLKVSGSRYVDVALMQKDGKEYIHLVNTAGEHRADRVKTFGEIPPLCNIKIEYECGYLPSSVILLPENKPVRFSYNPKTHKLKLTVKKLEIHSAIEVF